MRATGGIGRQPMMLNTGNVQHLSGGKVLRYDDLAVRGAAPTLRLKVPLDMRQQKVQYAPGSRAAPHAEDCSHCTHCRLPIGEIAYEGGPGCRGPVHAECKAELVLQQLRSSEDKRLRSDEALKRGRR